MLVAPVVNGLEEEFGDRLQVVRINANDRAAGGVFAALGVRGHPTIVLLDRDGETDRAWLGPASADDLRPLVEALLEP